MYVMENESDRGQDVVLPRLWEEVTNNEMSETRSFLR